MGCHTERIQEGVVLKVRLQAPQEKAIGENGDIDSKVDLVSKEHLVLQQVRVSHKTSIKKEQILETVSQGNH